MAASAHTAKAELHDSAFSGGVTVALRYLRVPEAPRSTSSLAALVGTESAARSVFPTLVTLCDGRLRCRARAVE